MNRIIRSLTVCALLTAASAQADDVSDAIQAAKEAYSAGNYSEAIQSLDYASQLVRQAKSEQVVKLLPPAPNGWEAEDGTSDAAGSAFLGGMVSARRDYNRTNGDGNVSVQVQSDSPMLQSIGMIFSNPMLMSASGAKVETIKGQKCAVTYRNNEKSGDIKALVDNRYVVTVEGHDVSRDDLLAFMRALDFAKLTELK
jgi:hypothetical protein